MDKHATVLYVDDNGSSRRVLTTILETRGFTEFDLALLDYQMPRMRGTELARELKRMDAEVPVVLISGMAAVPSEELAFVNVHLGQGTRLDYLLETIRMLAERRTPELDMASMQWRDAT